MESICEGCSKQFRPRRKEYSRFCSRDCAFAAQKQRGKLAIGWKPKERNRSIKVWFKDCIHCGSLFTARAAHAVACSPDCRLARSRQVSLKSSMLADQRDRSPRACGECGTSFQPEYGNKRRAFCSDTCSARSVRRAVKASRKARKRGVGSEPVNPLKVLERDGWRCQICGCDTPRDLRGTIEMNAPELDHKIPLARGGPHSYANTQCACRACNIDKSDKVAA